MRKIRKIISSILILAVAASVCFVPLEGGNAWAAEDTAEKIERQETSTENAASEKETPDNVVENEIIVVYEDAGVSEKKSESIQEEAKDSLTDMDIEVTQEVAASGEDRGTVVTAEIPEDMGIEEAIKEVVKDENISYAQPNYRYELMENLAEEVPEQQMLDAESIQINDKYKDAYYLQNTKVLDAWEAVQCNQKVTVAVLDTGCRMDHEDLKGNLLKDYAYDAFYEKPLASASVPNGGDPDGHGTHVSGLVAAEVNNGKGIAGTSYNASLLPVKLCDNSGKNMSTATLLRGMEYCARLVDENKIQNLRVMNISAGYYSHNGEDIDRALGEEIEKLRYNYGILCVCAGGNGDGRSTPYTDTMYPSDFDACLSVTALDSDGNNCVWSDYNSAKDISAPGERIISSAYSGTNSYKFMSGTSMAAPMVSGICALLWAKTPDLTVDQVMSALESTADPVASSATDGRLGKSGSHGAVNAAAALSYLDSSEERIDIGTAVVELELPQEVTYSGKRFTPEPTVKLGETLLVRDKDYEVSYRNNIDAGTAKVLITGRNGYRGSIEKEFTIEKASIAGCPYRISNKNLPYTGAAIRPAITVSFDGKPLKQGEDYTVDDEKNIEPGSASILVRGCGTNFTKVGRIRFTIGKADIRNLSSSLSASSYTYDKKAKKPKVTVKNVSHTPVAGKDLKISYTNNVNVGTATVTITGVGSRYTGTVKKTFRINPKGTSISKLKKKKKGFKISWKKQTAQTTGYQIQYALDSKFKSGKTKTIKKAKTTSASVGKLKRKKTYYVRVRTYKTVGNTKYYSSWSGTKTVKTK